MKSQLIKTLFSLPLLLLLFANQTMSQSPTYLEPCAKAKEPPAEFGPQEQTLCQRYASNPSEPLPLSIQIGSPGRALASQIVALFGSNQLSGHVSVVGNFTVDVDFSFANAVCSISPNVQILVEGDIELTLDNSKLFCCNGLWRGILLREDADIETMEVTEIEDALIAIDVPCPSSKVSIKKTIFNRNVTGIKVGHPGMLLAPCPADPNSLQFDLFSDNTFQCTSPLNGTQNGVGFSGITVLGNTVLRIGTIISAPSYFRQIRYGIYAPPESETTLIVNKCRFEDLLHSGIYQASGNLDIFQSYFTNCYANGIFQDSTTNLTVKTCWFIYDADLVGTSTDFHNGIHARRFGLNAQVSITYSHFEITNVPQAGKCRAIYLKPDQDGVSAGTQINIDFNELSLLTGPGFGIVMEDNFLNLTPESSIFHNKLTLFNAYSTSKVFGIYLPGDFQQFSITENDFYGIQRSNSSQNHEHTSIYLYGHGNSTGNIVAGNTWHLPENQTTEAEILDLDFDRAMVINTQEFASICYNQVQNVINVGTFGNLGLYTVFSNNTFAWMAAGPHIDGGEIGLQEHEGNQWIFPAVELNGEFYLVDVDPDFGFHIRCTPNPANSRFFVHTPQATVAFDVWHPFYPLDVEPEINFFFEDDDTPKDCELPGFGGNVPDLYKWLADDNTAALAYMSDAELWKQQRRLYRLLKTNPTFYASYSGFPGFVAQHQNESVGKFFQIHSLLSQSSAASATLSSEAFSQQELLRENLAEIAYLDSLLEIETSPGTILSLKAAQAAAAEDIGSAQNELKDLQKEYETPRSSYYQQALMVNSTVNAVAIYEVSEKAFNQVLLNALLNQSGNLTEQDAQTLKSIAAQCPETGGIAVVKSRSLLEDCYEDPTNDYTAECMGEFLTESQVNFRVVSSERNQSMTQTSVVVGEDIFLDVLFVEGSRYSLYDLNGRELRSGKLDPSLRIQIPSGLANGVYVCKVAYPSGKAIAQKVVITR